MRTTLFCLFLFLSPFVLYAETSSVSTLKYTVINTHPHDVRDFTQGLFLEGNRVFQSTGGYGHSALIERDLISGKIVQRRFLEPAYFGEGLTLMGDRVLQLTWQSGLGFIYDRRFRRIGEFRYRGEGWGLTHDGRQLILSDGTSSLRFLDATTFVESAPVIVKERGVPVTNINELEYARGKVWANLWRQSRVIVIDPRSGEVRATLDLSALLTRFNKPSTWNAEEDVLNGIAHDPASDHFFVTGKRWPVLYELAVSPLP